MQLSIFNLKRFQRLSFSARRFISFNGILRFAQNDISSMSFFFQLGFINRFYAALKSEPTHNNIT